MDLPRARGFLGQNYGSDNSSEEEVHLLDESELEDFNGVEINEDGE